MLILHFPLADHDEWEEHVVTAGDLAHIPHQLKSKMMAKFKPHEDEASDNNTDEESTKSKPPTSSSSGGFRKSSGLSKSAKGGKSKEEKHLKKDSDESDATSDD